MISVIIPVYKNYDLFFANLERNKNFFTGCEVVVMNDFPGEKIKEKVGKIIPQAICVDNSNNLGFGSNVNAGVNNASGNYILLLNSDVTLLDENFKKCIDIFKKDRKLFALSFAQYETDGKIIGANRGYFKDGMINHDRQRSRDNRKPVANFWAEGGSAIFRKDLFTKLGGFDPLFDPFYWEDIDLSYRAWKTGYKILYFPAVKVRHNHESTIGKYFKKSTVLQTAYRNQFIFQWKNLTDFQLLFKHFIYLPKLLTVAILTVNLTFIKGFLNAVILIPEIIKSRKKVVKFVIKKDRDVLALFTHE